MNATTQQPLGTSTKAGVPPAPSEPHQQAHPIALRAEGSDSHVAYIALNALRLDESNVRKDEPTDADIDELADLIDAQGLLQNLTVIAYAQPMAGKGKAKKGQYTHGVIAGGRRLRALQRLVKRGRLTLDEEILCTVVPIERALAVSAAENSGREPMSTADTIVAFASMVKAGAGIEELAVCFHLSPLTVQRRLKLADVSPTLFELFRAGGMTLDQLMALALTDDQATQEAVWSTTPEYDRSPRKLRALIAGDGLSSAIVRFVGLDAYEVAGGAVLRDLFAESDDQPAYVQDHALMMRLAKEKLEGLAQAARDEGAAWVEVFTSFGYSEREQFKAPPTTRREPTEQEAADLAALRAELDKHNEGISTAYDEHDDSDEGWTKIEALENEAGAVSDRLEALEATLRVVLPEVAAMAGTVVYIDNNGRPCVLTHQLRKADAAGAKRAAAKGHDGDQTGGTDDKAGALSERLCRQLTAQRTRALQAMLLDHQQCALAALVHPMLIRLVYDLGSSYQSPSALHVRVEDHEGQLKAWAPDLLGSRAEGLVVAAVDEARAMLPAEPADLLPWLLAQPVATLLQLLTLCSALSLNAISGTGKAHPADVLASALGLQMADWWSPSASSYLSAVPKALIVAAVKDAGMPDEAAGLAKLKKGEAVTAAEALLAGKRWVPALLR